MNYNKLEKLRKIRKLTIDELSVKIGMSKNGLSIALRGKNIKVETLERLSKALDVSPKIFFDYEETENLDIAHEPGALYKNSDYEHKYIELSKENEHLKEVIKLKDEIISVMKGK